jgi:hypothetical protein
VFRLDHHADPFGGQVLLQPVGDLLGQALLNLQIPGEQLNDPGQLRQTEDALSGQVTDMGDAVEGQQVVLTQLLHRDALGKDQLVVALVVREGRQVELSRGEQLGEGAGDSPRRT